MENAGDTIFKIVIFMPFFLFSLAAHEFAHAFAADRAGDPTAKYLGRLTINPMVHLDPMGVVFFVLTSMAGVGFGWAKPVPVNPNNFRNPRADNIKVSLAGITANFILIVISVVLLKVLLEAGIFNSMTPLADWIFQIFQMMIILNAVLMVFNLIPIPPLDGSHVLMEMLPPDAARAYARIGPYGMILILILMWTGMLSAIMSPFLHMILTMVKAILSM